MLLVPWGVEGTTAAVLVLTAPTTSLRILAVAGAIVLASVL